MRKRLIYYQPMRNDSNDFKFPSDFKICQKWYSNVIHLDLDLIEIYLYLVLFMSLAGQPQYLHGSLNTTLYWIILCIHL